MRVRAVGVSGVLLLALVVVAWLAGVGARPDVDPRPARPLEDTSALSLRGQAPRPDTDARSASEGPSLASGPPRSSAGDVEEARTTHGPSRGLEVASVLVVTAEGLELVGDEGHYRVYVLPAGAPGATSWDEVTSVERASEGVREPVELVVNGEGPWDVFLLVDQGRRWEALDVRAREARQVVQLAPTPTGAVTFEVGPGVRDHPLRVSLDALLSNDVDALLAPGRRDAYQVAVRRLVPPGVSQAVLHVPAWMRYESYSSLVHARDAARGGSTPTVQWNASPQQVRAGDIVRVEALPLGPLHVHLRVREPLPAHWPREETRLATSLWASIRGRRTYLGHQSLVLANGGAAPMTFTKRAPLGPATLEVRVAGMLRVPPREIDIAAHGTDVYVELVPDERIRGWSPSRPPAIDWQTQPPRAASSFHVTAPFADPPDPALGIANDLPVLLGSDQGRRLFHQRADARDADGGAPRSAWTWSVDGFEADACTRVGAYHPDGRVAPPVPRAPGESVELAFVLGGWLVVAPTRPPDARLGALRVSRADGFPLVVGGVQTEAERDVALAPRVDPGTVLGPLEPGSHRFHVRVGSQRLPDEIVIVRPDEISVLRIGD
ncbi:MAG: hypothetical protein AB7T63_12100 [Planctomycetota bacterium]